MERDALDPGFDQALQERRCVAIAAAAGIIGVVGDDERLVAGLALTGEGHCLGHRAQFDRREFARLPGVIHEFFGNSLTLRRAAIDCDRRRRADIMDIGTAEPGAHADH